ncbi:LysR substrate-binding domain-containing protein [Sphingomonas sp. MMS24-J13]|uniref:LysR family transcriptional regulator n=1 Tax=Sphingomonas sp. MMS24-J13 TaxID=3238686 RepID=UPI00384F464F
MMKLDGVAAFVWVAESGSISEAARRLGLAKSVVSERLAELERSLGVTLMQRTTRKLALTEDGDAFLPRARRIVHEATEAAAELSERRGTLSGPLRLAGPVGFGVLHLGPAIYSFLAAHPAIDLTLDLDDRFVDIASDGYDAVIRHGPIRDSRLIAKRLGASRRILVASPAFLEAHGTPACVADLEQCCAILYTNRNTDWRFRDGEKEIVVRPRAALRVNNGIVMRDAAIAGLGITLLPAFFAHQAVTAGALRRVDVGAEAEGAELHIAYPANRNSSAKIIALTAWLRQCFGAPPYWELPAAL